jgi:hypothetical protein
MKLAYHFWRRTADARGARGRTLSLLLRSRRARCPIDIYTAWEWPALCEAVSCLKVDPDRLPARIYDISYDIGVLQNANPRQSSRLFGGGGGNRTSGDSPDSDDSRTVSRTGIEENTSKEHEENALPDILVTMSQIPDVNRELAETRSMHALFAAVKREIESLSFLKTLSTREI